MSKKAGVVSAETKARLLQAAEAEFAEKGFVHSSLRRICDGAGVTTGALYFFFDGKDDLFEAVISQFTEPFLAAIRSHYEAEERGTDHESRTGEEEDLAISETLFDLYYRWQGACDILVRNRDHPAAARFMDDFVADTARHYARVLEALEGRQIQTDPFAVHWFSHLQLDAMLMLISHNFTREEARTHAASVVKMLRGAFSSLLTQ